jgi:glycosyltransferase involved in cell wall biosynthesis
MRLTILQFGPYAEAARRFQSGGAETFYGQRYSVEFVGTLASKMEDVTVLHLSRDDPEERLPSGVRSLGLEFYRPSRRPRYLDLARTLHRLRPDHMIVCSPISAVFGWTLARRIRTLPLFADSFHARNAKDKLKLALLVRLLNNARIEWVSNHNIAASLDLERIGVRPAKVLPFDWPALLSPADRPSKTLRADPILRLIYVGQVIESKGVGDLIDAISVLKKSERGPRWRASIVGGHDEALERRVKDKGLDGEIEFVGRVSHDQVVQLMSEHDAVIVPSRPEYPEGLPMTIYEGLCSRTPVVASDHPMFRLKLKHRDTALVFRAGDPASLAECLQELGTDGPLYARLSSAADRAAADFFCPLKFDELITRWLDNRDEDRRILSTFSLSSGRYAKAP